VILTLMQRSWQNPDITMIKHAIRFLNIFSKRPDPVEQPLPYFNNHMHRPNY